MENSKDTRVNYDEVSHTFDKRYEDAYTPRGIAAALSEQAREIDAGDILEVGCGTGHWLSVLEDIAPRVCGIDFSHGMLQKARETNGRFRLVRGTAERLPFRGGTFDLIFCVNAIHHFPDVPEFIREARRLLRHGGILSVVGMDPHVSRARWFIYDYFEGTYETDVERFPAAQTLEGWMADSGFEKTTTTVGERIELTLTGENILPLDKNFTSQLSLLSQETFDDGVARIEAALAQAEAAGETLEFETDVSLHMTTGRIGARK